MAREQKRSLRRNKAKRNINIFASFADLFRTAVQFPLRAGSETGLRAPAGPALSKLIDGARRFLRVLHLAGLMESGHALQVQPTAR